MWNYIGNLKMIKWTLKVNISDVNVYNVVMHINKHTSLQWQIDLETVNTFQFQFVTFRKRVYTHYLLMKSFLVAYKKTGIQ